MKKKARKKQVRPYGLFVRITPKLNKELMLAAIKYGCTKQALISGLLESYVRHSK